MWDSKQLYVPPKEVNRVKNQLTRLQTRFCEQGVCKQFKEDERRFRMPACSAYLRPTDKLQRPDVRMQTSGYHVPVCELEALWESTSRSPAPEVVSGMKLTADGIAHHSISMNTFEELFNAEMLGSGWFPSEQLKSLYEQEPVLITPTDTIGIHAQVYTP